MAVEPRRDNAAIAEQYPATFHRLQRMFRARGIPREEAADLAQETAARLLVHFDRHGQIDGRDDPTPLINRIATNLMIDRARSHARRVVSLDALEDEQTTGESLEDVVARRQRRFMVRRAMRDLNDRQRLALALSLDGLSPAEIADALGLERNAADALLHRARRRLAERLRSMPRELHGLGLVAMVKLRSFGRRSVETMERVAHAAPSAMSAMSAAIVLAVGGAAMPAASAGPALATAPVSNVAVVSDVPASSELTPRAPETSASMQMVVVNPTKQHVALQTEVRDPVTGDEGSTGLELWRDTERAGIGGKNMTGGAVDSTFEAMCDLSQKCGGSRE